MLISKEEILHCPRCNEVMTREPRDFWKCPRCGGEWWDDESKLKQIEYEKKTLQEAERLREIMLWSISKSWYMPQLSLVPVYIRRGGSRKSGRKRKKPIKKYLPSMKET